MEIRKLTTNDYESIIKLWSKAGLPFKPKGRDSREAIEAQIVANPEFFLGTFQDNNLIGTVVLSCDLRKGWINRLAVDPDYRHRGIAQDLIAESEKILRKCGVRIFCVLIEEYNDESKKLFKKCGYVEQHDVIYFTKRDSDDV
jgi:ribosomal protein S18 acetylase RimI-like enzyme